MAAEAEEAKEMMKKDTKTVIEAMSLFSTMEAIAFYKAKCIEIDVKPNNTFLKALSLGSEMSVMNFSNSYFGDRGMSAIGPTLGKIPVIALDLRNTSFSATDAGYLHEAVARHPTLTSIDLRDNELSVPTARRLLSLLVQNKRITTLLLDDHAPKQALIAKQCIANSDVCMYSSCCLVCLKTMAYDDAHYAESHLLLRLLERLGARANHLTKIQMETIFRCIHAGLDLNDNVLFLSGHECVESFVDDILAASEYVSRDAEEKRVKKPKHQALLRVANAMYEMLHPPSTSVSAAQSRRDSSWTNSAALRGGRSPLSPAYEAAASSPATAAAALPAAAVVEAAADDPEAWRKCDICGTACMTIKENTSALILRMLCHDVALMMQARAHLRPSAFCRLVTRVLDNAAPKVCSVKCLRAQVRFWIHGFGGVTRPRPSVSEEHVSVVCATPVPSDDVDFGVVDFTKTQHYDHPDEDTTCALAVASVLSDIEGTRIDPYFTFAAARQLTKLDASHFGVDLRATLESACVFGCLPAADAPYNGKSPRSSWADWNAGWVARPDFANLRRLALGRRKMAFYAVHQPGGNLFDEMRAALWTFRGQRRGLVGAIKWRTEWFGCRGGVIPTEKYAGGFYTAVKILGQCRLQDGVLQLIIQPMFGTHVGRHGFFFANRTVVNRSFKYGAYIFLEPDSHYRQLGVSVRSQMPLFSSAVSRHVNTLLQNRPTLISLLGLLSSTRSVPRSAHRLVAELLKAVPPPLLFALHVNDGNPVSREQRRQLQNLKDLFTIHSELQLWFVLACVFSSHTIRWLMTHLTATQDIVNAMVANNAADGQDVFGVQLDAGTGSWAQGSPSLRSADGFNIEWDLASENSEAAMPRSTTLRPVGASDSAFGGKSPRPPPQRKAITSPRAAPKAPSSNRRGKQPQQPEIDAAQWGAHEMLMANVNAAVERDKKRALELAELNRRRTQHNWRPPAHMKAPSAPHDKTLGLGIANLSAADLPAVVDATWCAVPYWTDPTVQSLGSPTHVVFFMQQCVAVLDLDAGSVVIPLTPMAHLASFAQLPFRNGFDACAVCTALAPNELFLFACGHWVRWDLAKAVLIEGPYDLRVHQRFRALPARYSKRLDVVIDVVGEKKLAFFSDRHYAVINLETFELVGEWEYHGGGSGPFAALARGAGVVPMAQLPQAVLDASVDGMDNAPREYFESLFVTTDGSTFDAKGAQIAPDGARFWEVLPPALRQFTLQGALQVLTALSAQIPPDVVNSISLFVPAAARTPTDVAPDIVEGGITVSNQISIQLHGFTLLENAKATDLVELPDAALGTPQEYLRIASIAVAQQTSMMDRTDTLPLDNAPSICIDFGSAAHCRFGYLQVVATAASRFVAPYRFAVSCSSDGIAFRRVCRASSAKVLSDVSWGPTHGARYWKVEFAGLPEGFKLARLLWYSASWSVEARAFSVFQDFVPPVQYAVSVEASRVLCPPFNLLRPINAAAVLQVEPQPSHYMPPHCVIPLLAPAKSSLFISGTSFVEWSWATMSLVTNETCSFLNHPAFSSLPFPFDHGFDACFYPDPVHSTNIVLVCGTLCVEWKLDEGRAAGPSVEIGRSPWLAGVPPPFAEKIDAIVNVWDRPGQIVLFSGALCMTWYVAELQIVDPPAPRSHHQHLHAPCFATSTLIAATSSPVDPSKLFLFHETSVAVVSSTRDRQVLSVTDAQSVVGSPLFPMLSWYLHWGEQRSDTSIVLDFVEAAPLFTGLLLQFVVPSGTSTFEPSTWAIDASEDSRSWTVVCAAHRQTAPTSMSQWELPSIGSRYYRIRLVEGPPAQQQQVLQARFQSLKTSRYTIPPIARRTNGRLSNGGAQDPSVPVELQFTAKLSPQQRAGIIFDYGSASAPELVALTISQRQPDPLQGEVALRNTTLFRDAALPAASRWAISCSDDAYTWDVVGTWRVRTASATLQWAPTLPRRFWRLELLACNVAEPTPVFGTFQFEEYAGIAACPPVGSEYRSALSVMCPFPWRRGDAVVHVPGEVGTQLLFDCKGSPQAFVGVSVTADVTSSAFTTRFAIEYSEDGTTWHAVGDIVVSKHAASTSWEGEGAFQFWRLVVTRHYGSKTVSLVSVDWSDSGPALYLRQRRHVTRSSVATYRNRARTQSAFISVRAKVPGLSKWIIERQSSVAMQWVVVGVLSSTSTAPEYVTVSWPPQGSSVYWRLRPVEGTSDANDAQDVQWYAFCGMSTSVAPLTGTVRPTITLHGLEWKPYATAQMLLTDRSSENGDAALVLASKYARFAPPLFAWHEPDTRHCAVTFSFASPARFSGVKLRFGLTPEAQARQMASAARPSGLSIGRMSDASRQAASLQATAGFALGDVRMSVELLDDQADPEDECIMVAVPLVVDSVASQRDEVLTWTNAAVGRHWRLRLVVYGKTATPSIESVQWLFSHGAVAAVVDRGGPAATNELISSTSLPFSRDLHDAEMEQWDRAVKVAAARLDSTFPEDVLPPITPAASIALDCLNAQKQAQKVVTKALKNLKRNASSTNNANVPIDVATILRLYVSTQADELIPLLSSVPPASIAGGGSGASTSVMLGEMKLAKESTSWLLPKTEYRGPLTTNLFNIAGCAASLAVRWRLDLGAQGNPASVPPNAVARLTNAAKGVGELLPTEWAAITFTVDITGRDWVPASHFPNVAPFLCEVGAPGRQLVVCVASSRIRFSAEQPLTLPNSVTPIGPKFPVCLYRGVNLLFELRLKACSSLEVTFVKAFMAPAVAPQLPSGLDLSTNVSGATTGADAAAASLRVTKSDAVSSAANLVATSSADTATKGGEGVDEHAAVPAQPEVITAAMHLESYDSMCASMRFTVPVQTHLGFASIFAATVITFEINADCSAASPSRGLAFSTVECTASFGPRGVPPFPCTLTGHVSTAAAPRILFDGDAPTGRWLEPAGIPGTLLDGIQFRGVASMVDGSLAGTSLTVTGSLRVLRNRSIVVPCVVSVLSFSGPAPSAATASSSSNSPLSGLSPTPMRSNSAEATAMLQDLTLREFLAVCEGVTGVTFPGTNAAWLANESIRISAALLIDVDESTTAGFARVTASGQGSLTFAGSVADARITVGPGGVSVTASLPSLRASGLTIRPVTGRSVMLEFFAPPDGKPFARVDGSARLLTAEAVPCSLDLSEDGVLVRTVAPFVEVFGRSPSFLEPIASAKVIFVTSAFGDKIASNLRSSPIIASLCSAKVPFSFALHAIEATAVDVHRRTIILGLHGVLLGSGFVVSIPCTDFRQDAVFVDSIAHHAALVILEHSAPASWPLVKEFIFGSDADARRRRPTGGSTSVVTATTAESEQDSDAEDDDPASYVTTPHQHSFMARWAKDVAHDVEECGVTSFELL